MGLKTAVPGCLLAEGKAHQLAGRLHEAAECFAMVVDNAVSPEGGAALAEGLRRLGVIHHLQGETSTAIHYCERSLAVATTSGEHVLAAEATMSLANMACEQGRMGHARELYRAALELSNGNADLLARIEQNLGIVESVQGNLPTALAHFARALQACEASHNVLGRARAHHNIGMVLADQKEWRPARQAYDQAASLARQGGDSHLIGLCLLNHAEIDMAQQQYDEVRRQAEAAVAIFERLGARTDMAASFRMLGTALRFLKRPAMAESRLRSALEIATSSRVPLTEAESCRDMAYLMAETDRRGEALVFLNRALQLFEELGAIRDATEMTEQRRVMLAA